MSSAIQEESLAGIQETRRDWSRHFVRWPVDPGKTGGVRRQTGLLGHTRLCQLLQHLQCSLCVEDQLSMSLRARRVYARRAVIREEAGGTFCSAIPRYNKIQVHINIQKSEMKIWCSLAVITFRLAVLATNDIARVQVKLT
jgi:hypothetical protein